MDKLQYYPGNENGINVLVTIIKIDNFIIHVNQCTIK